jgi:acetate kinase
MTMAGAPVRVLAINCGSSSLKHALFVVEERGGKLHETVLARETTERITDHSAAVRSVLAGLERGGAPPDVVGHRIVHGGSRSAPARIDVALLRSLRELVPFAPLHLPPEIRAIEAVTAVWPDRPQVACFDTAFHRTMSPVAERYALPAEWVDQGLLRYGFHGLSYEYVVQEVGAQNLGRAVVAHLGNGASLAAVVGGKSVDTTMGFSPAGGLVMGTRMGDVDPGLLVHIMQQGHGAAAIEDLVNRKAGLLGISGTTADVRDLLEKRGTDPRAALALDVFVWSARKWIGAMAASAAGIDTLVFTGGIGENSPPIRAAIAAGLEHLGVTLDPDRNARGPAAPGGLVSTDGARCKVRVVRTDEERVVARQAARVAS